MVRLLLLLGIVGMITVLSFDPIELHEPIVFTAPSQSTSESAPAGTTTEQHTRAEPENVKTEVLPPQNSVIPAQKPVLALPQTNNTPEGFQWGALVNILCTQTNGTMQPISGSGVLIDPRGVVLTNAHVAQFLLLSTQPDVQLSCVIRTGSPASGTWTANLLYMPAAWVEKHAADIKKSAPLGTGEHDYAFFLITGSQDGSPLPQKFPYVPFDVSGKESVGNLALLAAYPAEFANTDITKNDLKASPSITPIQKLLTFARDTVDVIALQGVPVAQSGSSGGAVLNQEGRLIGIISTTSEGKTPTERDLHAITLSYINRSLQVTLGYGVKELLSGDVAIKASEFTIQKAPALGAKIIEHLKN